MEIEIMGAAGGEVTGSMYRVRTRRATLLVDCGMFQGGVAGMDRNRDLTGGDESRCDAVVLTHAHLDHTGRLPLWIQRGFRGPVFASQATLELADIILQDSAKIQAQDAVRTNRKRERAGQPPVLPLYGPEDVVRVREQGRVLDWGLSTEVAEGMRVRLFEAGHLLGSASVELTVEEGGKRRVIVFSGDLGPPRLPIVRDFDPPPRADLVFLESTYGDRNHRPYEETVDELERILREMVEARGKILVPTFAIGRAQQILYHLRGRPGRRRGGRSARGSASSSRSRGRSRGRTSPSPGSPPCSPQMPSLMPSRVARPFSTRSPSAAHAGLVDEANGFFLMISILVVRRRKLPESSRLMPRQVWVRSLVPKLKNSAVSAISSAVRAARGTSIMVPTR
jgi:glyoxylase-like metal-dependent hydrolase (beta-lactamase superfamily II)